MNSSAGPCTHRPSYPKIYVPAHFDSFLQVNHEDLLVDSTARPHTYRCNRFSSHLFILKLSFRLTIYTDLSTHLLYYIFTPTPPSPKFISLYAYLNFSRQGKSSGLPINSSAGPRNHKRTRKWTYLFILMAHFRLITKTYVSNQLVVYLSMDAPFPQNHLFIFMLSFRPANHKHLLFDSTIRLHAHRWTCSSTYLRILIPPFRLTLPVHFALALHMLSLIHIWRCRRGAECRSRWSPYH